MTKYIPPSNPFHPSFMGFDSTTCKCSTVSQAGFLAMFFFQGKPCTKMVIFLDCRSPNFFLNF